MHSEVYFSFILAFGQRAMGERGAQRIKSQQSRRNGWRLISTQSTLSQPQRRKEGSATVKVLSLPRRTCSSTGDRVWGNGCGTETSKAKR
jgi:hypothetical protein